ncbi:hypothetical protein LJC23_04205 [Desulfovibrio sp. OttesenSCG-928-I05]|nr:hypothetical protein [Desulfovibrio sp. OttesenSCG-928-I05]
MIKKLPLSLVMLVTLCTALGGCAAFEADTNGDPANTGLNYYYDEFPDVPIPVDMSPEKDRFTIMGKGGVKLGIQEFSGRVDKTSLVNAMQNYMLRDGWTLRSHFRATRSILVFEKPDRICSLYFVDGAFSTQMLVFISPKLDDGDVNYQAPLAPAVPLSTDTSGGYSADQPLTY